MDAFIRCIDVVIPHIFRTITAGRHRTAVGPLEKPSIAIVFHDTETSFVHQLVVRCALCRLRDYAASGLQLIDSK
jgi:hypothetical protein